MDFSDFASGGADFGADDSNDDPQVELEQLTISLAAKENELSAINSLLAEAKKSGDKKHQQQQQLSEDELFQQRSRLEAEIEDIKLDLSMARAFSTEHRFVDPGFVGKEKEDAGGEEKEERSGEVATLTIAPEQ